MKKVIKPWGYEKWLDVTDKYVLKEIFIKAGYKTSLQYHEIKMETDYILKGKGLVHFAEGESRPLSIGDVLHLLPRKVHRILAFNDLTMVEVSTPEVDDVVRVEDDWGRKDGRIESEHS